MPWVGLSRSAAVGEQIIYKNFVGFFIKMLKTEFLGTLSVSDGSVQHVQKIEANPVGSFDVTYNGHNLLF